LTWLLPVYVLTTAVNAFAGLFIAKLAPQGLRLLFRTSAIFQICLIYFAWRLSPQGPLTAATTSAMLLLLDKCMATGVVLSLGIFSYGILASVKQPALAASAMCGVLGIALLSGYPVQLAIGGAAWWTCIQDVYPDQALGFSG